MVYSKRNREMFVLQTIDYRLSPHAYLSYILRRAAVSRVLCVMAIYLDSGVTAEAQTAYPSARYCYTGAGELQMTDLFGLAPRRDYRVSPPRGLGGSSLWLSRRSLALGRGPDTPTICRGRIILPRYAAGRPELPGCAHPSGARTFLPPLIQWRAAIRGPALDLF